MPTSGILLYFSPITSSSPYLHSLYQIPLIPTFVHYFTKQNFSLIIQRRSHAVYNGLVSFEVYHEVVPVTTYRVPKI